MYMYTFTKKCASCNNEVSFTATNLSPMEMLSTIAVKCPVCNNEVVVYNRDNTLWRLKLETNKLCEMLNSKGYECQAEFDDAHDLMECVRISFKNFDFSAALSFLKVPSEVINCNNLDLISGVQSGWNVRLCSSSHSDDDNDVNVFDMLVLCSQPDLLSIECKIEELRHFIKNTLKSKEEIQRMILDNLFKKYKALPLVDMINQFCQE